MSDKSNRPSREPTSDYPAVRTTIVDDRPPGSGFSKTPLGPIPRGVEVLVKKASVDPAFRAALLARRSAAAQDIGLTLEPAEAMMLDIVPAAQLEAIIARTKVEPSKKPAFLGKAAAVMLVALGASSFRAPAQVQVVEGVRAAMPTPTVAPIPASQPSTQPASQPASAPAVPRDRIMPILTQLDSDSYQEREAAQKKLQELGAGALQPLRELLKDGKLSAEVTNRVKTAMWNIKTTTRPALLEPARPAEVVVMKGLRADPPPVPQEKPED